MATSNQNLYQRGGVWYVRVQQDGKEIRRSLKTKSLAEAKRRLATMISGQANAPRRALIEALASGGPGDYFVYFIQGSNGGPIKIGRSRYPAARLSALQKYANVPLVMVACIRAAPEIETVLHERFGRERLHHEWFRCTARLKRFVAALAEQAPQGVGTLTGTVGRGVT
jgi:hypothetical protein